VFTLNTAPKLGDIMDGTSNTIAVGEVTAYAFKNGGHLRVGTGVIRNGAGEAVFRPALVSPPFSDSQGSAGWGYPSPDGVNNPQPSWSWWRAGPHAYKASYLHCFGFNAEWPGADSLHVGGCHFLLADGTVRFLSQNISYPGENTNGWASGAGVWGALNTCRGREVINNF